MDKSEFTFGNSHHQTNDNQSKGGCSRQQMVRGFWNARGIIHIEGRTISAESNVNLLDRLKSG